VGTGSKARRRGSNSYRAAPPQTQGEALAEGAEIVREVPGAAGIILAGSLRDLMLWVESDPAERGSLFAADAAERRARQVRLPDLEQPLWMPVVALALVCEAPLTVDVRRVVDACRRISAWADGRGLPATRLAFVQAAALLRPEDASLALEVARLARELGQPGRAESWFRHAIRLTRRSDWEGYVWAYVGLGVLYIQSGNLAAADTLMRRALTTARRRRLRPLAGVAHHHLFTLAVEGGRIREGYEHVQQALACYGPDHPRLAVLVLDLGLFWVMQGSPERARPLLERVSQVLEDPNLRAKASANSAWAAAAASDRSGYERFRERTLGMIADAEGRTYLDDVYLNLAYADMAISDWERAIATASRASALARSIGRAKIMMEAEAILAAARAAQNVPARPVVQEDEGLTRRGNRLAGVLLTALSGPAV
jgi:tetratricopeptide (TPR) repeat protein